MTAPAAHRLLRASAGTGKTYQLVQAYVRLVQEDKLRPAQIVAITFTRKAAAELRLRIRAELHARGAPPSVLSELSRAPLGNFHGLALQIMASFGLDAGLYGPIQILAEAHADRALFAQGCADAWFAGDTQVATAVETVAPYLRVGDTFSGALWEAIALAREDGIAITADHLAHADAPALLAPAQAHLEAMRSRLLAGDPALTAVAVARLARFAAHPVPALASVLNMPATATVDDRAKAVADWHAGWQAMFACLDRRSKLKYIYSAEDAEYVRKDLGAIQAGVLTAALRPAVGTLLMAGWRAYGRLKAERGLVDFVDIIERFNALMHARPDLHAALRGRYAAVLVDEAQDTNRLQRAMVDLLCGFAGPAAAEVPPAQAFVVGDWKQSIYTFRGADPQSFNDFASDLQGLGGQESHLAISRRSQPALVHGINSLGVAMFGERYEPLAPLLVAAPATVDENANGRPPNNALRGAVGAASAAATAATTAAASAAAKSAASVIATAVPTLLAPQGAGMHWLSIASEPGTPARIAVHYEAQAVAKWVADRLAAGAAPGDFAILMTAMGPAPTFLAALQAAGIPAVMGGGSGFYLQPEIRDHVACLAWLADPDAELQAAICLRSPLFGLSDAALWTLLGPEGRQANALAALRDGCWALAKHVPDAVAAELSDADRLALQVANQTLPKLVACAASASVAEVCQALDVHLEGRAVYLTGSGGAQRVANIQRLWRIAAHHDRAHGPDLQRFVDTQLDRLHHGHKEALPAVPTADRLAVTLSTVHQSKGLQYPIVILPTLARQGAPSRGAVAYARGVGFVFRPSRRNVSQADVAWREAAAVREAAEMEEKKRLLYVAITRAEREVLFVGPPPEKLAAANFGRLLKPWTSAMPAELAVTPAPPAVPVAPISVSDSVPDAPAGPPAPPGPAPSWPAFPPARYPIAPGSRLQVTVSQLAHDAEFSAPAAATAPPAPRSARPGAAPVAPELSAAVQGEIAHNILARLGERPAYANDATFVDDMLRRLGHAPDDPRVRRVVRHVNTFLASPLGQKLVALPETARRHELPFQLAVPHGLHTVVLNGQLDLAFCDGEGAAIVDFKHTTAGPQDAAYLRQLDAYAWALSRLAGASEPVRCYLVYLKDTAPPRLHMATIARQAAIAARLETLASQLVHQAGTGVSAA